MPALANQRHERFAQGLATGKSAYEAYANAGYNPDRGAASRMSANINVVSRVGELKDFAAKRVEISVASVTEALYRIAKKAEALQEPAGLAVARAAMMDAAKLNGLVVEKAEVRGSYAISDRMPTPEEWEAENATEH